MKRGVVNNKENDSREKHGIMAHNAGVEIPQDAVVGNAQGLVGEGEPEGHEDGVLHEAKGVVEKVLVAGALFFGVEEGEDVDGAEGKREHDFLASESQKNHTVLRKFASISSCANFNLAYLPRMKLRKQLLFSQVMHISYLV